MSVTLTPEQQQEVNRILAKLATTISEVTAMVARVNEITAEKPERKVIMHTEPNHCDACGHPKEWHDDEGCRFMFGAKIASRHSSLCRCSTYRASAAMVETIWHPSMVPEPLE